MAALASWVMGPVTVSTGQDASQDPSSPSSHLGTQPKTAGTGRPGLPLLTALSAQHQGSRAEGDLNKKGEKDPTAGR